MRHCAWCGKPGGTASQILRRWCDEARVPLKNDSAYFHGGKCAEAAKQAMLKANGERHGCRKPMRS